MHANKPRQGKQPVRAAQAPVVLDPAIASATAAALWWRRCAEKRARVPLTSKAECAKSHTRPLPSIAAALCSVLQAAKCTLLTAVVDVAIAPVSELRHDTRPA